MFDMLIVMVIYNRTITITRSNSLRGYILNTYWRFSAKISQYFSDGPSGLVRSSTVILESKFACVSFVDEFFLFTSTSLER